MSVYENSDYASALFPIKECPVTFDTPNGDVETNYRLIVRDDSNKVLSCMTDEYQVVKNETIQDLKAHLATNERERRRELALTSFSPKI